MGEDEEEMFDYNGNDDCWLLERKWEMDHGSLATRED
jgi:hypothetical protein